MRLHDISTTHEHKKGKRLGRGDASGKGSFSGKGVKGQKARTGANSNIPRTFTGGATSLIQSMPKLKGFKSHAARSYAVNVSRLAAFYDAGAEVTLISLVENGLISANEAKKGIKIVGSSGESPKYTFEQGNPLLKVTKKLLA
jgi:large subunit ribosomal protein L15